MPCIEAKLSMKLSESQKDTLQKKIADSVSEAFNKPKIYIMAHIQDEQPLYMNEQKLDKGACVSISLLGNVSKSACQRVTEDICNALKAELDIDGSKVYIIYHPVELWGWNGTMF